MVRGQRYVCIQLCSISRKNKCFKGISQGKEELYDEGNTFPKHKNCSALTNGHVTHTKSFNLLSPFWPLASLKICLHLLSGGWLHLYHLVWLANLMLFGLSLPMHKRFMAGCSHPDVLILFLCWKTPIKPTCLLYFFNRNAKRKDCSNEENILGTLNCALLSHRWDQVWIFKFFLLFTLSK